MKFKLIVVIPVFMGNLNFMLSCVEHEKHFITSRPSQGKWQGSGHPPKVRGFLSGNPVSSTMYDHIRNRT